MSVHTPVAPSPATTTHDCGCGCGGRCGCETRCCDLECLVRPNFFCGQMLTDADLDRRGRVDAAAARRSSRYRDGWGIACGLHVSCAPHGGRAGCCDPADGPVVYVNPGYAVDCCGNDLVVCEPLPVDSRRRLPPGGRSRARRRSPARPASPSPIRHAPQPGTNRRQGLLGSPEGRRLRRRPVAALPRRSQPRTAGRSRGDAATTAAASTRGSSNARACTPNW